MQYLLLQNHNCAYILHLIYTTKSTNSYNDKFNKGATTVESLSRCTQQDTGRNLIVFETQCMPLTHLNATIVAEIMTLATVQHAHMYSSNLETKLQIRSNLNTIKMQSSWNSDEKLIIVAETAATQSAAQPNIWLFLRVTGSATLLTNWLKCIIMIEMNV